MKRNLLAVIIPIMATIVLSISANAARGGQHSQGNSRGGGFGHQGQRYQQTMRPNRSSNYRGNSYYGQRSSRDNCGSDYQNRRQYGHGQMNGFDRDRQQYGRGQSSHFDNRDRYGGNGYGRGQYRQQNYRRNYDQGNRGNRDGYNGRRYGRGQSNGYDRGGSRSNRRGDRGQRGYRTSDAGHDDFDDSSTDYDFSANAEFYNVAESGPDNGSYYDGNGYNPFLYDTGDYVAPTYSPQPYYPLQAYAPPCLSYPVAIEPSCPPVYSQPPPCTIELRACYRYRIVQRCSNGALSKITTIVLFSSKTVVANQSVIAFQSGCNDIAQYQVTDVCDDCIYVSTISENCRPQAGDNFKISC